MKIKTESIKSKSNILNKAYSTGDSINMLILLDFENEKAYMKSVNGIHISFDFEVEEYDKDICDKIITDASKFLTICTMYDDLEVVLNSEEKIVFKNGENDFQLSYFEDTNIIPTSLFTKDYDIEVEISLNDDLVKVLKKASTYLSKDDNSNPVYRHVFIEDGTMVAMSEESNILMTKIEGYDDCKLYRDVLDYITLLHTDIAMNLSISEKNYILECGDIKIIFPHILDVKCPPVLSEKFSEFSEHETNFTVNKLEILKFLSSVKPFTSDLINNSLYLTVKDNNLILSTTGKDKITINFEVKENIGLTEDFTFIFEGNHFPRNIKNIEGELVTIEVGNKILPNTKGEEKEAILCQMYSEKEKEKLVFKRLSDK